MSSVVQTLWREAVTRKLYMPNVIRILNVWIRRGGYPSSGITAMQCDGLHDALLAARRYLNQHSVGKSQLSITIVSVAFDFPFTSEIPWHPNFSVYRAGVALNKISYFETDMIMYFDAHRGVAMGTIIDALRDWLVRTPILTGIMHSPRFF